MSHKRPVIAITGPDRGGVAAWLFTSLSIRLQGGKPKRITPSRYRDDLQIDGLVIGGGADVEPAHYLRDHEKPLIPDKKKRTLLNRLLILVLYPLIFLLRWLFSLKGHMKIDKRRDELEFRLLEDCISKRLPVLGICRGAQLINVHHNGTLHQELSEFYEETPQVRSIFPRKKIHILEGTHLFNALAKNNNCMVNAMHDQAIKETGKGLIVAARETANSVIQAIEHPGFNYMIGVQWHPEYLILDATQRNLFRVLVESAKESTRGKD